MYLRIVILAIFLNSVSFLTISTFSQDPQPEWLWAKAAGSQEISIKESVADSIGNVIVLGEFYSPSTQVGGQIITGNDGVETSNVFIAKYNAEGRMEWVKSIYGSGVDAYTSANDVKIDKDGNIFVLGHADDAERITVGTFSREFTGPHEAFFIVKIYKNGRPLWIQNPNIISKNVGFVRANDLFIDEESSIYITGQSGAEEMSFDDDVWVSEGADYYNLFTVKYNVQGEKEWSFISTAGDPVSYAGAAGIAITGDHEGNIIIAGEFWDVYSVFIKEKELINNGQYDIIMIKVDADGNYILARSFGNEGIERPGKLLADDDNNIILSGGFTSKSLSFDENSVYYSGDGSDVFVAKHDPAFNNIWLKGIPTQHFSFNPENTTHLNVGSSGNVYLVSTFLSNSVFEGGNTLPNVNPGSEDIFIAKYGAVLGNILWTRRVASQYNDNPNDIAFDEFENVFITGTYYVNLDLDAASFDDPEGNGNMYLLRYNRFGGLNIAKQKINQQDKRILSSSITTDGFENIYLTGFYYGEGVSLDDTPVALNNSGTNGVFLGKLSYTGSISGTVYDDEGNPVTDGYVKLISYTFRQRSPRSDSIRLNGDGSYVFDHQGLGRYIVYAVGRKTIYPHAVGTYFPGTSSWVDAEKIRLQLGENITNVDFTLINVPVSTGSATLGGIVSEEEESDLKSSSAIMERPVKSVTVVLIGERKNGEDIVSYTKTNQTGDYIFYNIPPGTYMVIVDIAGLEQVSTYQIEVTEDDEILNLNYLVNYEEINATEEIEPNSIYNFSENTRLRLYPNPNSGEFYMMTGFAGDKNVMMELYDIAGKQMLKENISTNTNGFSKIKLKKHLSPGVYFIQISSSNQSFMKKMVIQY